MVVCTLEQRYIPALRHYFETLTLNGNVAEFVRKLGTEEEKHRQLRMFIILWKKWNNLASSSINQGMKSQIQLRSSENIAAGAESACETPSTLV